MDIPAVDTPADTPAGTPAQSAADAPASAQSAILDLIAGRPEQLTDRMGIELTEITPGRVTGTMPVEGNKQPFGLMHGGASCVLAETLGSIAAGLHAGPDRVAVGIDLNATHHRAVRRGTVTGVCTPLAEGSGIASYEIAISDEAGRRVCTARLTCALRARAPR